MRWTPQLLISVLIGYVQARLEISELRFKDILSSHYIFKPLEVPCNESLCTGPLSEIYCHGPILTNSWQFGLQKTCPGDKLKVTAKEVLANFNKLPWPLKKEVFQQFCEEHFEQVNYLEVVNLTDYEVQPKFLNEIGNLSHRKLAAEMHERWERLARQFTSDVQHHPDLYPLIPVQNPFIVPGGRFDVYFYWDTFWIIKGLLVSRMFETTKGIINNFSNLVVTLGYIPNSGNLQLSRRSQPPLFPHMIWEYTKATGNYEKQWIDSMDMEMKFWENNRTIAIGTHKLFLYKTLTNCPRPENFLGDFNIGKAAKTPSDVWRSISSACESGWDFSSRWMHNNDTDLSSIHTDLIIPVDLNVFIANNYRYMAYYANHFGRFDKSASYRQKYEKLRYAIQEVLWDNNLGAWFDYDISIQKRNLNFYPSNVYPLMLEGMDKFADRVEDYMKKSGALEFVGGIPSSLPAQSTQQWDFPNVWAPNQHFVIQSFMACNNSFLQQEAKKQAMEFIETVYNGMYNPIAGLDGGVWEKYDARSTNGAPGAGGEYVVQEGFGWTNGAVMDLIWTLRDSHKKQIRSENLKLDQGQHFALVLTAFIFCIAIAFIVIIKGIIKGNTLNQRDDEEAGARLLAEENDEDDQEEL
ncbi:Trehalase [Caenorhabditis elegans]|uniref:Trehalase n=1 Tax=Caenorhabditis elegans TaxID=6239 RepID=G5EDP3_CAEEL|nr:Trehalase [Caenorhabditis elegans]CAA94130.2 Trehalase [Caenorhabditis elegans]CAD54511.1 trehalase [Caenorhabditis elegans]|eukprot:NP_510249.2 Trehalase [Caenorhabditis elegans]